MSWATSSVFTGYTPVLGLEHMLLGFQGRSAPQPFDEDVMNAQSMFAH